MAADHLRNTISGTILSAKKAKGEIRVASEGGEYHRRGDTQRADGKLATRFAVLGGRAQHGGGVA
jgi:hypothetical protein